MPVFVHCNGNKLSSIGGLRSVADPVGSEPFWSDPDAINCPDPGPTKTQVIKQEKKLIIYIHVILFTFL